MVQRAATSLGIDIIDSNSRVIGAIQSFSPSYNRNVTALRELNTASEGGQLIDVAGEIVELIPGVENITLSVNGFLLNGTPDVDKTLFNRVNEDFKTGDGILTTLVDQQTAFSIKVRYQIPGYAQPKSFIYEDCFFETYNQTININGDIIIGESATIRVRKARRGQ